MKHIVVASVVLLAVAGLYGCKRGADARQSGGEVDIRHHRDRISYMIGHDIAKDLAPIKDEIDIEIVNAAIRESLAGKKPLLDEGAIASTRKKFFDQLRVKRDTQHRVLAQSNARKAKTFLAANAKRNTVRTTASGLQYQVLRAGKGAKPGADDTVRVNYTGSFLDGRQFENTYAIDHPASFPLGQIMPGWREGVVLMDVGSKYRFWLPSRLAYGEHGVPGTVGPNEALMFEIELLEIASRR